MSMQALLSERPGPPEALVLRQIAEPKPGIGEARVRVEACGINYPDVLMIQDKYQFTFERPFAPGIEICGIVDALGPDVHAFPIGTRIVVQVDCGGLAEKAVCRVDRAVEVPADIAPTQAAAMLLTYGTSYHALRDRAALNVGETLLVLGAGGGVGLAAVEIGKMMGARVVAAVSSDQKAQAAREMGADEVILYPATDPDPRALAAQFKGACPGGCDVIYDPVGGAYAEPALRTINWGGRYLVVGFAAGIPRPPFNLVLLKGCQVIGVFWGAAMARDLAAAHSVVVELFELVAKGSLKPSFPHLFPLERGGEAIAALRDRTAVGKLVVTP